ncbi:caspase-23 [Pseudorasbora parva]|uniref:caspase-23 n=1 Tax=Pseudorasbora parva TaxID=51549 RepID=UPI00351DE6EF
MTEEVDNWDGDLEEDAVMANVFKNLNLQKHHISQVWPSTEKVDSVALPCGHQMPADYVIAWFKYYLKQKKTNFSCPGFNEIEKKTCGTKLSYQDICQLIPLTDKQREFLEENLAALVARRLFDFKACPGCQSHVERRDRSKLCVNCTICTANMKRTYYFCWNCRREWKGPANNAVCCENNACGQRVKTSDPLKPCKPESKREILRQQREDIYPVKVKSPERKRLALLINNVEFKHLNDRTGAEKDELSMEILLNGLGYTVVTLRDLTAKGMIAAMQDFARREEHVQSDSCFVVLMSHGDASGICGVFDSLSDDEEDIFPTDYIFNSLNTPNCAGLRDKPKIILIQACRGGEEGSVDVQDCVRRQRRGKEHREKDFCCLRSCTPDTVSYRNIETGSHFIQDIVEIFNEHACEDHIEELFRKVLKKFKEKHPDQMPSKERTTLSKRFYLFPGL